jgi:molybdopterin synthase sulfur carrier subunit
VIAQPPAAVPHVQFTRHLVRFFPNLAPVRVAGATAAEVVRELDRLHPGLADYVVDERGALRRHVNLFIGEQPVRDRMTLSDPVGEEDEVYIMQALSGG